MQYYFDNGEHDSDYSRAASWKLEKKHKLSQMIQRVLKGKNKEF